MLESYKKPLSSIILYWLFDPGRRKGTRIPFTSLMGTLANWLRMLLSPSNSAVYSSFEAFDHHFSGCRCLSDRNKIMTQTNYAEWIYLRNAMGRYFVTRFPHTFHVSEMVSCENKFSNEVLLGLTGNWCIREKRKKFLGLDTRSCWSDLLRRWSCTDPSFGRSGKNPFSGWN